MHTLTHTHTHTLHYTTLCYLYYITSNSKPTSKTKDSQLLLNVIEMFSLESQGILRLKGGDIVTLW